MRLRDAVALLAASRVGALGPTTWADLGCGDGTFTVALAELVAPGSTIHAMDLDGSALRKIPASRKGVGITTYQGDFANASWPFAGLDGILLANSLHYVKDQARFVGACEPYLNARRFLIVEYDTDDANPWVPYPVSLARLTALFTAAGYSSIEPLGSRASIYRRAAIYAALVTA
jgi:trans-aconitate methyltransferase